MGAGCKITGRNENETISNQKRWLSGWSKTLIEQLEDIRNGINIVKNGICVYDNNSSQLRMTRELLTGIVRRFERTFTDDKELDILESIKKTVDEFIEESDNTKPVNVDSWGIEWENLLNKDRAEQSEWCAINIEGNSSYFNRLPPNKAFWEIVSQIKKSKVVENNNSLKELVLVFNSREVIASLQSTGSFDFLFDLGLENGMRSGKSLDKISVLEALRKKYSKIKLSFVYRKTDFVEVDDIFEKIEVDYR